MLIHLAASQTALIAVPPESAPIQHYLRQPQRLVSALVDPSRVELLGGECFRLKMRPLSLLDLSFQPTVDLKVWTTPEGTVYLKSMGCEIRGIDYINQRFSLTLAGILKPRRTEGQTYLDGQADLQVRVELPPPLWLTPTPILETAGNGLLKSVLLTIKQRLMSQLLADYQRWARTERNTDVDGVVSGASLQF
jgi:hypothetical protein